MRSSDVSQGADALAEQYNHLRDDAEGASRLLAHEQATPDMTLKIEAGSIYFKTATTITKVDYAGGDTPSFSAPSANPRIDIVSIDSSGTVSITQGVEAASPTAPTYPTDEIVICEVYHRVGETTILDADDSTNGYISKDVRNFLQHITLTVGGKFGGDGSDGALSITSGTTTIDISSASIIIKNYTSISITGTGKLAFSNPAATGSFIHLKSQGGITLTSSTAPNIDASGMGAAGGDGATDGSAATNGTTASEILDTANHYGGLGSNGAGGGVRGAGGAAGGAATNLFFYTTTAMRLYRKALFLTVGSGGGGGGRGDTTGNNGSNGANGGRGGAALLIECGGAWNFTVASGISVAGATGSNASNASGAAGGGGGGGNAGTCIVLYETLTASSGSIVSSGGAGGSGGTGGGGGTGVGGGGGGGGGGGYAGAGTAGTGGGSTYSGGAGGAGANGFSLIADNTEIS